jgi:hypothetical protein
MRRFTIFLWLNTVGVLIYVRFIRQTIKRVKTLRICTLRIPYSHVGEK